MSKIHIACFSEDAGTADKLASELRDCDHVVRIAQWQDALGPSIAARLRQGPTPFDYLVVVFSGTGNAARSSVDEKRRADLAEQLDGPGIKVYPLSGSGGELTRTADISYDDLVNDWSGQLKVLCEAVS